MKEILLLPNEKTMFLLSGKCGSSSVRKMAMGPLRYYDKQDTVNRGLTYIRSEEVKDYPDYRKIMLVRNPYTRMISLYRHKVLGKKLNRTAPDFRKFGLTPRDTFKEAVIKMTQVPDEKADPHFRSQTLFYDYVQPDMIIKLEAVKKHWPKDLPHIKHNNASGLPPKIEDYYKDEETYALVFYRYKRDFELLHYKSLIAVC